MHKRTILLAEDDPIQRRMVKRMVETDIGCTVLEAEDGVDALELLKQKSSAISLLLVDLNMPRMTGVELLHQIKIFLPNLPFIVLTASEKLEDAVEAMQLGAVDFITKPAQRERIITSIKNAIMMRNLVIRHYCSFYATHYLHL
jgi:DNA-binding NtrC family response regulator